MLEDLAWVTDLLHQPDSLGEPLFGEEPCQS